MHQPADNDETHTTPQPEAGERAVIISPHAVVTGPIITGDGNIVESDMPEWFAALRQPCGCVDMAGNVWERARPLPSQ
jgi:hypothetical protein